MNVSQLESASRTVAAVAAYFEELKAAARALKGTVQARTRGYFTPGEDEETRHLLVSYVQARNALLELVTAYRDDTDLAPEDRPAAFLAAFAAAVLLIDAARFLREEFGDHPAIRAKLNEPEPHFGVAADTLETIERSLTSPRTAWHIYHAARYYREHEAELRRLAAARGLDPCLEVIERLWRRLDVDLGRLAQARLRARAAQAELGLRRDVLGRAVYGLLKLGGCLMSELSTRPGHHPSLPPAVRAELGTLLRPGDVFITRKEHAATNYFLPGYWPHAVLYLGDAATLAHLGLEHHPHVQPRWVRLLGAQDQDPRRVLEAQKDGVHIRSIDSPFGVDAVVVLRPRLDPPQVAQALARGLFHEGKPYDFDFDFTRSDRLVCTEVVYRAYDGIGDMRFALTRRAGRLTLAAEDLLAMALARNGFEPLAAYAPPHATHLATGAQADDLIRATHRPR